MLKNRSFDSSSPVHSFVPSAIHQNMNISSHQFNASTRNTTSLGAAAGGNHSSGIRPSLSLLNGTLQKTFATGYVSHTQCTLICLNNFPMLFSNLARIIRNDNSTDFDDPSEPIYTDPSMFERSRYYNCDTQIYLFNHMHFIYARGISFERNFVSCHPFSADFSEQTKNTH